MRPDKRALIAEQKRRAGEEGRRQRVMYAEEIRMNKIAALADKVGKRETVNHKRL